MPSTDAAFGAREARSGDEGKKVEIDEHLHHQPQLPLGDLGDGPDTHLSLHRCNQDVRVLTQRVRRASPSLTSLDLSRAESDETDLEQLYEGLQSATSLERLDLSFNRVSAAAALKLAETLSQLTRLTHLDMSGIRAGWSGSHLPALFEAIPSMASLTSLDLSYCDLDVLLVGDLCDAIGGVDGISTNLPLLTHFNVAHCGMGSSALIQLLDRLSTLPSLESINLAHNFADAACARQIGCLLIHSPSIHILNVADNDFGCDGILSLCDALSTRRDMTVLNMSGMVLDTLAVIALGDILPTWTGLNTLCLSYHTLYDDVASTSVVRRDSGDESVSSIDSEFAGFAIAEEEYKMPEGWNQQDARGRSASSDEEGDEYGARGYHHGDAVNEQEADKKKDNKYAAAARAAFWKALSGIQRSVSRVQILQLRIKKGDVDPLAAMLSSFPHLSNVVVRAREDGDTGLMFTHNEAGEVCGVEISALFRSTSSFQHVYSALRPLAHLESLEIHGLSHQGIDAGALSDLISQHETPLAQNAAAKKITPLSSLCVSGLEWDETDAICRLLSTLPVSLLRLDLGYLHENLCEATAQAIACLPNLVAIRIIPLPSALARAAEEAPAEHLRESPVSVLLSACGRVELLEELDVSSVSGEVNVFSVLNSLHTSCPVRVKMEVPNHLQTFFHHVTQDPEVRDALSCLRNAALEPDFIARARTVTAVFSGFPHAVTSSLVDVRIARFLLSKEAASLACSSGSDRSSSSSPLSSAINIDLTRRHQLLVRLQEEISPLRASWLEETLSWMEKGFEAECSRLGLELENTAGDSTAIEAVVNSFLSLPHSLARLSCIERLRAASRLSSDELLALTGAFHNIVHETDRKSEEEELDESAAEEEEEEEKVKPRKSPNNVPRAEGEEQGDPLSSILADLSRCRDPKAVLARAIVQVLSIAWSSRSEWKGVDEVVHVMNASQRARVHFHDCQHALRRSLIDPPHSSKLVKQKVAVVVGPLGDDINNKAVPDQPVERIEDDDENWVPDIKEKEREEDISAAAAREALMKSQLFARENAKIQCRNSYYALQGQVASMRSRITSVLRSAEEVVSVADRGRLEVHARSGLPNTDTALELARDAMQDVISWHIDVMETRKSSRRKATAAFEALRAAFIRRNDLSVRIFAALPNAECDSDLSPRSCIIHDLAVYGAHVAFERAAESHRNATSQYWTSFPFSKVSFAVSSVVRLALCLQYNLKDRLADEEKLARQQLKQLCVSSRSLRVTVEEELIPRYDLYSERLTEVRTFFFFFFFFRQWSFLYSLHRL